MKRFKTAVFLLCFPVISLLSYDPHMSIAKDRKIPKELENIGFSDVVGNSLPLHLTFQNERGESVVLKDLVGKGKPILFSFVYFKCPTLCNVHLNGVFRSLRGLDWTLGKEFDYIAISIDPREDHTITAPKREAYWKEYSRGSEIRGLHFLTGKQESITELTKSLGFRYAWDEESQQFIHASGVFVLTPEGKVSRLFQGVGWESRDLKFSFLEAASGKIGSFVDQIALFCFQFDPTKNRYTIYAYRMMQIGGAITLLLLGTFLLWNWRNITNNNRQGVT